MSRYYHESNYHRQIRFIRKLRRFAIVMGVLMASIGVFVLYDTWRSSRQANRPSAPTAPLKSTFASSLEVYRTQYFQFQANKTWRAVANESTSAKFVYHKFNSNLVEAQLVVYVNQAADKNIDANRVLPVTFSPPSDKLNASFISERCAKDIKNAGYKTMALQGVTFRCNTDSTDYSVLVGSEGGSTLLNMTRPDNTKITYVIHFRDFRAIVNPQDFEAIADTFQTR